MAIALAIAALGGTANADFVAPLLECTLVTVPAKISTCATAQDPLGVGVVRIGDDGDLDIAVYGAGANQTYTVQFRPPTGSPISLGNLSTGAKGNGDVQTPGAFAKNKVGAGSLVLSRTGGDQYVSGVAVSLSGIAQNNEFLSDLVACKAVNDPAGLTTCLPSGDPLRSGSIEIEADDGDLTLGVRGAAAKATYQAVLRPVSGTDLTLASVTTDTHGNGVVVMSSDLAAGTIASGTVVLKRAGDQFFSAFDVTRSPLPKTESRSSLVRCLDVNYPTTLLNCGADTLSFGAVSLDINGKLQVVLSGAVADTTYQVFFRPLDTTGTSDGSVLLTLTTDVNGNANKSAVGAVAHGSIGSGGFVVKAGGQDQFVPGFTLK